MSGIEEGRGRDRRLQGEEEELRTRPRRLFIYSSRVLPPVFFLRGGNPISSCVPEGFSNLLYPPPNLAPCPFLCLVWAGSTPHLQRRSI